MSFAEPNESGTSAYALDTWSISVLESWQEELERGSGVIMIFPTPSSSLPPGRKCSLG